MPQRLFALPVTSEIEQLGSVRVREVPAHISQSRLRARCDLGRDLFLVPQLCPSRAARRLCSGQSPDVRAGRDPAHTRRFRGFRAADGQRAALEPAIRAVALRRPCADRRFWRPAERHRHRSGHAPRRDCLECDTAPRRIRHRSLGKLRLVQAGLVLPVRCRAGGLLAAYRQARPRHWSDGADRNCCCSPAVADRYHPSIARGCGGDHRPGQFQGHGMVLEGRRCILRNVCFCLAGAAIFLTAHRAVLAVDAGRLSDHDRARLRNVAHLRETGAGISQPLCADVSKRRSDWPGILPSDL